MRAHRQKEPLVPLRSTKNPKGKKKFDSFRDHINALCSGMRVGGSSMPTFESTSCLTFCLLETQNYLPASYGTYLQPWVH